MRNGDTVTHVHDHTLAEKWLAHLISRTTPPRRSHESAHRTASPKGKEAESKPAGTEPISCDRSWDASPQGMKAESKPTAGSKPTSRNSNIDGLKPSSRDRSWDASPQVTKAESKPTALTKPTSRDSNKDGSPLTAAVSRSKSPDRVFDDSTPVKQAGATTAPSGKTSTTAGASCHADWTYHDGWTDRHGASHDGSPANKAPEVDVETCVLFLILWSSRYYQKPQSLSLETLVPISVSSSPNIGGSTKKSCDDGLQPCQICGHAFVGDTICDPCYDEHVDGGYSSEASSDEDPVARFRRLQRSERLLNS